MQGENNFHQDHDNDGVPNGVEAWLGTAPDLATGGLTLQSVNGLTYILTHPYHSAEVAGISGSYEWSPDLINWYSGNGIDGPDYGLNVTVSAETDTENYSTTVTAISSSHSKKLFFRISAINHF